MEFLVVDAKRVCNRVDGITLLDDVDLAILVVVVSFNVRAADFFGTREAELLADLEEASRLSTSADGGIEFICRNGGERE